MIARDADPVEHRAPYKRVDLAARRRKPIITRQEIEDNLEPVPDPAFYEKCPLTDNWRLKA